MELLLQPDHSYACQRRVRTDPGSFFLFFFLFFKPKQRKYKILVQVVWLWPGVFRWCSCRLALIFFFFLVKLGIQAVKKHGTAHHFFFNLQSIFTFRNVNSGKLKRAKALLLQFTERTNITTRKQGWSESWRILWHDLHHFISNFLNSPKEFPKMHWILIALWEHNSEVQKKLVPL